MAVQWMTTASLWTSILDDLTNLSLSFHQVIKIVERPFPFPYTQVIWWLLMVNAGVLPIVMLSITPDRTFAALICLFAVVMFFALELVARELENSFGSDANDIDFTSFQELFNDSMESMLHGARHGPFNANKLLPTMDKPLSALPDAWDVETRSFWTRRPPPSIGSENRKSDLEVLPVDRQAAARRAHDGDVRVEPAAAQPSRAQQHEGEGGAAAPGLDDRRLQELDQLLMLNSTSGPRFTSPDDCANWLGTKMNLPAEHVYRYAAELMLQRSSGSRPKGTNVRSRPYVYNAGPSGIVHDVIAV